MRKFLILVMVIMSAAFTVAAQTETDPKAYLEIGKVTLKMDMPAVKDSEYGRNERDVSIRRISYEYAAPHSKKIGVVRVGSPTTYLKGGLTAEEVVRVLGKPAVISKRMEDGRLVTTYEFQRGGKRMLIAEFEQGKLVRSRTETREQIAQATH